MPKRSPLSTLRIPFVWVKNVYNLCATLGQTGAHLSTPTTLLVPPAPDTGVKLLALPHIFDKFFSPSYTAFHASSNLLFGHLSPLSTPPIINKMKEK